MARLLIDKLEPGTTVTLRFDNSGRPLDQEALFLSITGEGPDRLANFITSDSIGDYKWSAYRFKDRWAYGTSAERLSLVGINANTNIGD